MGVSSPRFNGIYAHTAPIPPALNPIPAHMYKDAFEKTPEEHLLSTSTTYLFRELALIDPLTNLLKDGKSTAFHIIGSADGTEVYTLSTATALKQIPNFKNPEHLKMIGVDLASDLIGLSKTWHLVITDFEKRLQTLFRTPLSDTFDNFFTKKDSPPSTFDILVENSPQKRLAQYTRDPVAGVHVGNGMHWYKAKNKKLPSISFEEARLEDYVTRPSTVHERQIYIFSNSLVYTLLEDTKNVMSLKIDDSPEKRVTFLKVFQDLKEQNQGKDTWVVLGSMEDRLLKMQPELTEELKAIGFRPVRVRDIKDQMGVSNQDQQTIHMLQSRIFKLIP